MQIGTWSPGSDLLFYRSSDLVLRLLLLSYTGLPPAGQGFRLPGAERKGLCLGSSESF